LLVGSSFVKSLALALNIPLLAINHMQAHVLVHFMKKEVEKLSILALTISGGHTQIIK
jgi:N6-L-threonylcarbamoyladenine synthase